MLVLTFDLTHNFDFGFSGLNFENNCQRQKNVFLHVLYEAVLGYPRVTLETWTFLP